MSYTFARYELPPLPNLNSLEEPLPPLPPIEDKMIETRVFTHSSYIAKKRTTGTLLFDAEEEGRDNEKYEHLGDSLLGVTVTLLLQDMYPTLSVGTATTLRSLLVANKTLRQISHLYHLPSRLLAPAEQRAVLINGDKVPANLFEAYIGGVYYSYLNRNARAAGSPPPSRRTIANVASADAHTDLNMDGDVKPDIWTLGGSSSIDEHGTVNGHGPRYGDIAHSSSGRQPKPSSAPAPTPGEARDYLDQWLRPLFARLAQWALNELKEEQAKQRTLALQISASARGEEEEEGIMEDAQIDTLAIGALARLNEWFIAKEGAPPVFSEDPSGNEWKVECRAVDKNGTVWSGAATRSNKKSAKTVAAYKVCLQFKAVRPEFDRS
ncbi:hypothetical protein IAT40_000460 [Kwoniella sp. CBS 6097]